MLQKEWQEVVLCIGNCETFREDVYNECDWFHNKNTISAQVFLASRGDLEGAKQPASYFNISSNGIPPHPHNFL